MGLEMEIVELARQADEAAHDGWPDREAELRSQLEKLYSELATVAERLSDEANGIAPAAEVDAPLGRSDHPSLAEEPGSEN